MCQRANRQTDPTWSAPLIAELMDIAERLVAAAAQFVISVSTAVKDERLQASADRKRDQRATCKGYIAVGWNRIAAEVSPGIGSKPHRKRQKPEQRDDKDRDKNEIVSGLNFEGAGVSGCAGDVPFSRGHNWLLGLGFKRLS